MDRLIINFTSDKYATFDEDLYFLGYNAVYYVKSVVSDKHFASIFMMKE
jgi:hypothetical protein